MAFLDCIFFSIVDGKQTNIVETTTLLGGEGAALQSQMLDAVVIYPGE